MKNSKCCERFVDVGGMKYIFPVLTGGGMKKVLKKKGTGEKRNFEESAISIISQLCTLLGTSQVNDYSARILFKLTDKEHEKLQYCVDLLLKYNKMLESTNEMIAQTKSELIQRAAQGDLHAQEELEELESDDDGVVYAQRLEGGLFNVQQLAMIITFACIYDKKGGSSIKVRKRLESKSTELTYILKVMRDLVITLEDNLADTPASANDTSTREDADIEMEYYKSHKNILTQWCAALSNIITDNK